MLWGLTVLLIPLTIHLLSKRELEVIKIGSLQLFESTPVTKARKLLPTDLMLLILRCLMIAALVIGLAQPVMENDKAKRELAIFIDPHLYNHPAIEGQMISDNAFWFQKGFDPVSSSPDTTKPVKYWELADKINDFRADSVVLMTASLLSGTDIVKPRISGNINWIVLDPDNDLPVNRGSFRKMVQGKQMMYNILTDKTHQYYKNAGDTTEDLPEPLEICLFTEDSTEKQELALSTYLNFLASYSGREIKIFTNKSSETQSCRNIWLKRIAVEEIKPGDIILKEKHSFDLFSMGDEGTWLLHRIPDENDMRNDRFARQWMALLDFEPEPEFYAHDMRRISSNQLIPSESNFRRDIANTASIAYIFFLITIILTAIERYYAYLRNL